MSNPFTKKKKESNSDNNIVVSNNNQLMKKKKPSKENDLILCKTCDNHYMPHLIDSHKCKKANKEVKNSQSETISSNNISNQSSITGNNNDYEKEFRKKEKLIKKINKRFNSEMDRISSEDDFDYFLTNIHFIAETKTKKFYYQIKIRTCDDQFYDITLKNDFTYKSSGRKEYFSYEKTKPGYLKRIKKDSLDKISKFVESNLIQVYKEVKDSLLNINTNDISILKTLKLKPNVLYHVFEETDFMENQESNDEISILSDEDEEDDGEDDDDNEEDGILGMLISNYFENNNRALRSYNTSEEVMIFSLIRNILPQSLNNSNVLNTNPNTNSNAIPNTSTNTNTNANSNTNTTNITNRNNIPNSNQIATTNVNVSSNPVDEFSALVADKLSKVLDKDIIKDKKCVICIEQMIKGETVCILPCLHIIHKDCFIPCIENSSKCPICKFDISKGLLDMMKNR